MKNKKEKNTNWWSIAAFIFSIVALCLSFFRVKDTYDLSDTSYISIIVTLMGVCATFIVCYQIYNGIEMNQRISRLEKLEEDISKWEVLKYETEGNLEISKGLLWLSKNCYNDAFYSFQAAFGNFLMAKNDEKTEDTLANLKVCADQMNVQNGSTEIEYIDKFSDTIEAIDGFSRFKTAYHKIILKIKPWQTEEVNH